MNSAVEPNARDPTPPKPEEEKRGPLVPWLLLGIAVALFLKFFVVDIQKVSGPSMETAIHDGATVVVWRLSYGVVKPFADSYLVRWGSPAPGDIVTFYANDKPVIKRCLAVENTPIVFSTDNGYSLTVGEKTIPLTERQYQRLKYSDTVPAGTFLAIGDNYGQSTDSRDYGFVRVDCVTGRALCR